MNAHATFQPVAQVQLVDDLDDIETMLDLVYMAASNCQDEDDGKAICLGLSRARDLVKDLTLKVQTNATKFTVTESDQNTTGTHTRR